MHASKQPCKLTRTYNLFIKVLDWGKVGLIETLKSLEEAEIHYFGAGFLPQVQDPLIFTFPLKKMRIVLFGFGSESSGVPESWMASKTSPGVNFIKITDYYLSHVIKIIKKHTDAEKLRKSKFEYEENEYTDIIIVSIHWGFKIHEHFQTFAHRLIDEANVDVIHGHSSHHVRAMEIYKGKPIIYGCGDFISDYEGIDGAYQSLRDDLAFMYFIDISKDKQLQKVVLSPTRLKNFRIQKAEGSDAEWLFTNYQRESAKFGLSLKQTGERFQFIF